MLGVGRGEWLEEHEAEDGKDRRKVLEKNREEKHQTESKSCLRMSKLSQQNCTKYKSNQHCNDAASLEAKQVRSSER